MFKVNKKPVYEESYIDLKLLDSNALKIWQLVTGIPTLDYYQKFCSPFRIDNNPDCYLRPQSYKDKITLFDYADPMRHKKSLVEIFCQDKNLTPRECGQFLYFNYLMKVPEHQIIKVPKYQQYKKIDNFKLDIRWRKRSWNSQDKEYWGCAGISKEDLKREKVYGIKEYWMNKKSSPLEYYHQRPKDTCYGYTVKGLKKLYFPTRPKGSKFISQIKDEIGGRGKIQFEIFQPNEIVITKSCKDSLVVYNAGFNCRFTNSESHYLPIKFINWLNERFDYIFLLYDSDEGGIRGSDMVTTQWRTLTKNNKLQQIYLPNKMDSYEYAKEYGVRAYEQQLLELTEEAKENLSNL